MQNQTSFLRTLRTLWKQRTLTLMVLPAIILLCMFHYVPLYGMLISFKEFNYTKGIMHSPWIGLANFKHMFVSSSLLIRIVRNTLMYFAIFTIVGVVCNVTLAIMLNECTGRYYAKISHTILILPTFLSIIAVSYIVSAFLGTSDGLVNNVLAIFGKKPVNWYMSAKYWPFILTIVQVWRGTGYGSILYLSALCGMDPAIFEAARIDGAGKFKQIRYLTIPMLLPMISIMLLLSVGGIMSSDTGLFYRVTLNSGILYSTTQTVDAYVMNAVASGDTNFGMTSAVSMMQSFTGLFMVMVTNLIVRRIAPENALF